MNDFQYTWPGNTADVQRIQARAEWSEYIQWLQDDRPVLIEPEEYDCD